MMSENLVHKPVDRTGWLSGPWDLEIDRVEFEAHGFPCLLNRNHFGAWCGYCAVPPGHPWHGKGYQEIDSEVSVHGGLTYADACHGNICHVPKPGEPDNVWWFGFDCNHGGDRAPGMEKFHQSGFYRYEVYCDLAYARQQTENLARQAKEAMQS
jgi:hypothetical protein